MIFVTVGTHEQQFNRLIKEVDRLKGEGLIQDEVFIQTGFSDYEPVYCQWKNLISYDEMNHYMDEANIIITHGGPATFMGVISRGKRPIVVPRQEKFGEHVNDHQLEFSQKINEEYIDSIELIQNIEELRQIFYKSNTYNLERIQSNNTNFNRQLITIINDLIREEHQ